MKIYHTETQADFDALMVELESKGIETVKNHYWKYHKSQTAVFVRAIGHYGNSTRIDTTFGGLRWALRYYPTVPIQKYTKQRRTRK